MSEHYLDKQSRKRGEANDRNAMWSWLSHKEQLAALDSRPGRSTEQRRKITAKILAE